MKTRRFIKKNRLFVLFILLVIFALLSTNSFTDNSFKNLRVRKIEETRYNINNLNNMNVLSDFTIELKEYVDNQVLDDMALIKLFHLIRNMEMLFFKLILLLSLYDFCQYIKRWFILSYQFKFKFFIMRYLELKDGKKDALSFRFSF